MNARLLETWAVLRKGGSALRRIGLIFAMVAVVVVMATTGATAMAQELLPEANIPGEPGPTEAHPSICHAESGGIESLAC